MITPRLGVYVLHDCHSAASVHRCCCGLPCHHLQAKAGTSSTPPRYMPHRWIPRTAEKRRSSLAGGCTSEAVEMSSSLRPRCIRESLLGVHLRMHCLFLSCPQLLRCHMPLQPRHIKASVLQHLLRSTGNLHEAAAAPLVSRWLLRLLSNSRLHTAILFSTTES